MESQWNHNAQFNICTPDSHLFWPYLIIIIVTIIIRIQKNAVSMDIHTCTHTHVFTCVPPLHDYVQNLIPSVPIILGAGGDALHLKTGDALASRRLGNGRCSVAYVANDSIKGALSTVMERAAAAAKKI